MKKQALGLFFAIFSAVSLFIEETHQSEGFRLRIIDDYGESIQYVDLDNVHDIEAIENNIYIVGDKHNKACYWKNGEIYFLSESESSAHCLSINNGDVYIGGYINQGDVTILSYWKNNIKNELPVTGDSINEILGWDNHVFILYSFSSDDGEYIKYWYDGKEYVISEMGLSNLWLSSLKVVNDDIYLIGYETKDDNYYEDDGNKYMKLQAKYWKNGMAYNCHNDSNETSSEAVDMIIQDDGLFVVVWTYSHIDNTENIEKIKIAEITGKSREIKSFLNLFNISKKEKEPDLLQMYTNNGGLYLINLLDLGNDPFACTNGTLEYLQSVNIPNRLV